MTLSDALRILELTPPYTVSQIKVAYREQLMVWHPDRFVGNENLRRKAQERTCQINEAFSFLETLGPTNFSQPNPPPPQTAPSSQQHSKPRQTPQQPQVRRPSPPIAKGSHNTPKSSDSKALSARFWVWCLAGVVSALIGVFTLNRERADSADEAFALGRNYCLGIDKEKNLLLAKKWLEKAADQGSTAAIRFLATSYQLVQFGSKDKVVEMEVYRKYAERGNAGARYDLGYCYILGDGVEKNPAEGLRWWKLSALQGDREAQHSLAIRLFEGDDGIPRDTDSALLWYEKAAEQGVVEAQFTLGDLYCDGENGVTRDFSKAKYWLQRALDNGHKLAKTVLKTNETRRLIDMSEQRKLLGLSEHIPAPPSTSLPTSSLPSVKPDDTLMHRSSDLRLASGTILTDNVTPLGGKGKLTLDNGLLEDAFVKLVQGGRLAASFYVRGGTRQSFSQLPDGSYDVLYCTGFGWEPDRRDFARGRSAHKYVSPLVFSTRNQVEAGGVMTYTDALTLTLHKVAFGNARTTDIPESEFDQY